jgi:uncharacterized protein (TIGR03435 family)
MRQEVCAMRRALASVGLLALLVGPAFGQTTGSAPSFDAAEVHLRAHTSNAPFTGASGGVLRGGRYDLRNVTMVDLIATAYGITDPDLIVGGPNWLERDRFDISAKAAPATTPETVKLMLQSMLADRFKLVLHKDTRPAPGFVLTVAKGGHKMKEAPAAGAGCQGQGQPQANGLPMLVGTCKGLSMELFAQQLRSIAGPYINSPVTDQTGLKGTWDFDIRFTPFAVLGRAGSDGISLTTALEQQLGLSLERKQVPTLVTIVDSVNQKPTDNPSGVSASIPSPPPMEFDVAEIKLSQPDAPVRTRLLPGGRIEADGVTMKMILQLAWDITMDELVAGTPKWFDETKYSIVAKTSTAVSGAGSNMNVDIDDLKAMLRALITERFKLKTHYEDRAVTAYTLLADRPKMAKADPANRTGWKEGPAPDQKDQRNAILGRMVTAKNMTMAQFADDLQRMANGYIRLPVEDKTGLDGAYDFAFAFTPIGLLNGPGRGRGDAPAAAPGAPGGGADASDPTGGVSLYDAVSKQLGLKLEMRKRPMPVLVIDHIEEKPTDN